MAKKQQDVNLGKAAIFFGVLCVLGIAATAAVGGGVFGFIAAVCGLLAIACYVLWSITRTAANRTRN